MAFTAARDSDQAIWHAPLAPVPSATARWRSQSLRALASLVLPRRVLFSRGRGPGANRKIALTFDDGPDAMTLRYLELLDELDVPATFFLVGERVARMPGIVGEYVRRGHDVGSHGWSHVDFRSLGRRGLDDELRRTRALLESASAVTAASRRPVRARRPMVRPPWGSLSPRTLFHLSGAGYTTVLWSLDSDDCRTRDPEVVVEALAPERLRGGDVVLLHEGQPWTIDALGGAIERARSAGFEFATVTEMLGTEVLGRSDAREP